jgi:hypothetical protein
MFNKAFSKRISSSLNSASCNAVWTSTAEVTQMAWSATFSDPIVISHVPVRSTTFYYCLLFTLCTRSSKVLLFYGNWFEKVENPSSCGTQRAPGFKSHTLSTLINVEIAVSVAGFPLKGRAQALISCPRAVCLLGMSLSGLSAREGCIVVFR